MTVLAVRAAGSLSGAAPLDPPEGRDPWAQNDETARLSAAERAREAAAGPLVPAEDVPLVLLHAFPLSSLMWEPLVRHLPKVPVLMVDLPGAGLSPSIDPVSIEGAALAVATSLEELGVQRAVIAGISMGGYVALQLMASRSDLISGVILMHTKATPDTPEAQTGRLATARTVLDTSSVQSLTPMAGKMISEASKVSQPELEGQLKRWILESTPDGVAWAEEAMATRPGYLDVLRASGLPATVIAGEEDPFSSVADAEAMADALGPGTNLVVISSVGHLSPLESPSMTARILREAYQRLCA